MNFCLPANFRAFIALFAIALTPWAQSLAQSGGYQAPSFAGAGISMQGGVQQIPTIAASPLAGGPAAAQGGQFMDAQGNPIVLPAQYCQSCPSGSCFDGGCYPGGYCGPGVGGYGDPMAVDFGGYGEDQCGPHYFDVQFGTVFLQAEDTFEGLQPFTAAGIGSPDFFLDPAADFGEYEPGWEIAARYDIGALAVIEASYMGLYDIGFSEQVISSQVALGGNPNALVSVFNNFGLGGPIDGIDAGSFHSVDYQADLQSTEINYRRYWVGNKTRISGTYLLGARYLRFTDDFAFNSTAVVPPAANDEFATLQWSGENDLVGFHFGGDAWLCLRQGLRIGVDSSIGIYNNRFKFNNSGTFTAAGAPDDFTNTAEGNQVAYASETDVSIVADILPSWSIRGGYRVMFLNSLVTASNNIDQSAIGTGLLSTQESLLFHGFHGGLEYIW